VQNIFDETSYRGKNFSKKDKEIALKMIDIKLNPIIRNTAKSPRVHKKLNHHFTGSKTSAMMPQIKTASTSHSGYRSKQSKVALSKTKFELFAKRDLAGSKK
jgi:hypothetical protein